MKRKAMGRITDIDLIPDVHSKNAAYARGFREARAAALREAVTVTRREYRAACKLIGEALRAKRPSLYHQGQRASARSLYNELRRLK